MTVLGKILHMAIRFRDSGTDICVEFSGTVVDRFRKFYQRKDDYESGGMLFSNVFHDSKLRVTYISTPTDRDIACKSFFQHDRRESQKLIDSLFSHGLHYVGDWHSHFEKQPKPSVKDIQSMKAVYNNSQHELKFMLHVIVGSSDDFRNAYVCITDGVSVRKLECID